MMKKNKLTLDNKSPLIPSTTIYEEFTVKNWKIFSIVTQGVTNLLISMLTVLLTFSSVMPFPIFPFACLFSYTFRLKLSKTTDSVLKM